MRPRIHLLPVLLVPAADTIQHGKRYQDYTGSINHHHSTMTETEIALQQAQAGVDASQALLGLGVSIEENATTPELMAEQESPSYEDPIDHPTPTTSASNSAELRPDTNPHLSHDSDNTTASAVTDEDQPAVAVAAASRPKSGTMRRKVAKRTYGSPVFASKPPPAPVPVSTTTTNNTNSAFNSASTKNDYYKYDESVLSASSVPALQLFRESAFRPLTETAAIIESEMGVASLEDLDMAAPMLLYSLSTSSSRNFNRKRKQRELQQQQEEQQAAAEDMLLFTPAVSTVNAHPVSVPSRVPSPKAARTSVTTISEKKKPVSSEKVKRTRSKPSISLKKQESISSAAASNGRSSKTAASKTSAASKAKTKTTKKKGKAAPVARKVKVPEKVKRTYLKKGSTPPMGKMARSMKPAEPLIALPQIRSDVQLPWPMNGQVIPFLHSNDVLSGRGNGVAIYPGNRQFREFIRSFKDEYVRAFRNEKGNVASDVIRTVLSLTPPGRFVEKAKNGNGYQLVDYSRALEKTSQALREGSAALRVMVFKDMYNKTRVESDTAKLKDYESKKAMNTTDKAK
jgi:hypothetical protein